VILGAWATHQVVPTRLLERFVIAPELTPGRLHSLQRVEGVQESFILSTCDRVEYYVSLAATADPAGAAAALVGLLVTPSSAPLVTGGTHELAGARELVMVSSEADAVRHLFSVACGLDSMLIGEHEVVAQLREALRLAEAEGAAGHVLGNLVRGALRTSKTVRTQTGIGSPGKSMISAGLDWAGTGNLGAARSIVDGCVLAFQQWRAEDQPSPLAVARPATADRSVDAELRRPYDRLPQLDHRAKRKTGAPIPRAAQKLIHTPAVLLAELATAPRGPAHDDALAALLDLEEVADS
jgi:glutamyl-tRNA reductase